MQFPALLIACVLFAPGDTPKADVRPVGNDPSIEGLYLVEGGETEKYRGLAVVQRAGEVYVITQLVGGSVVQSVGVRVGSHMSLGWQQKASNGQTVIGTTHYSIGGDAKSPILSGSWASVPGNGQVYRERLTFLREMPTESKD